MQYTIWKKDNWEILEGRRRWAANSSGDCPKRYKDVLICDQGRCSHFSPFFLVKPGIKWCSEARRQLRIHFSLFCDFHIPDISLFCRLWLSLCSSWSLKMSLTKIFSHLIDFSPKDKLFYSGSMLSCVHLQLREAYLFLMKTGTKLQLWKLTYRSVSAGREFWLFMSEMEFVTHVTHGGSVKFLPAV